LSGGEKARVALAVFATRPADVLLLDEPTNHLDGAAVAALSQGLREHQGAVIVASHDMAFVDELQVTHTAKVARAPPGQPGSLQLREGAPEELVLGAEVPEAAVGSSVAALASVVADTAPVASVDRRQADRARWRAEKLMRRIESTEAKLHEAEQEMHESHYSEKTCARYANLQAELETLYEQWEASEG